MAAELLLHSSKAINALQLILPQWDLLLEMPIFCGLPRRLGEL